MKGKILNYEPHFRFKDYNFLTHCLPKDKAVAVLRDGEIKSFVQAMADGYAGDPNTHFRAWQSYTISFGINWGHAYDWMGGGGAGFIFHLRDVLTNDTCLTVSGIAGQDEGELRIAPLRYTEESQKLMNAIATIREAMRLYEVVETLFRHKVEKYQLSIPQLLEFSEELKTANDLEEMRTLFRKYSSLSSKIAEIYSRIEQEVIGSFRDIERIYEETKKYFFPEIDKIAIEKRYFKAIQNRKEHAQEAEMYYLQREGRHIDCSGFLAYIPKIENLRGINYNAPKFIEDACPFNFTADWNYTDKTEEIDKQIQAFPSYVTFKMGRGNQDLPQLYAECRDLCTIYVDNLVKKFVHMHGEVSIDITNAIFVANESDMEEWEHILKEIGRPIIRYYGSHSNFTNNVLEWQKKFGRHMSFEKGRRLFDYLFRNNLAMKLKTGLLGKRIQFFKWNNYTQLKPVSDKEGKIENWTRMNI
ncbi:MAG: hypothetical protein IH934_06450 [Nanoarchaeota archaeon]|nr:hypothetical protein [Nanoarchaeota archaeon]